jgi:hypothetical protein
MLRAILGACLLLALTQGSLTAQGVGERWRAFLGCYELRLVGWNSPEGQAAAASIPDRIQLTPTVAPPRTVGGGSGALSLDLQLGPAPGYGSSEFVDERWSFSSADSLVMTWGDDMAGVQVVLAVTGSGPGWRVSGRTAAWNAQSPAATPGEPATAVLRGRAAGRGVDCYL